MDIKKFTVYTIVGCLLWSAFLTYIGFVLGENWMSLEGFFHKFQIVIVILLAVAGAWYVRRHFKHYKT